MKSFTRRIAGPVPGVSFCTCDDGRALCPSCRDAALPGRCPDCGAELLTCEGIDGQTDSVCPDYTRWEPTYAA